MLVAKGQKEVVSSGVGGLKIRWGAEREMHLTHHDAESETTACGSSARSLY